MYKLTLYRNLAVQTKKMTKYIKIHPCNKHIPSCNIYFWTKLNYILLEVNLFIQVNILFDLFALMFC